MKLEELYLKDITREVNPAVSADDFSDSTVKTEIEAYVFTDDIINALYGVMSAIKDRKLSHDGIWINGYFGSGKSHFIKFLDYCLSGDYRDLALARLTEAVVERDPLQVPSSKSTVMVSDMNDLVTWIKTATIDTILFNIGTVHNARGEANREDKAVAAPQVVEGLAGALAPIVLVITRNHIQRMGNTVQNALDVAQLHITALVGQVACHHHGVNAQGINLGHGPRNLPSLALPGDTCTSLRMASFTTWACAVNTRVNSAASKNAIRFLFILH